MKKSYLSVILSVFLLCQAVIVPSLAEQVKSTEYQTSFESYNAGDVLAYTEYHPAEGKLPNYPEGELWGLSAVNGYLTYASADNLKSQRVATYAEDVINTSGQKLKQTYSYRNVGDWTTFINGLSVTDADAKTGTKSLKINNADVAFSMGIKVSSNTEYTLTYYVKDFTSDHITTGANFGVAVMSSINFSDSVHATGGGEVTLSGNIPYFVASTKSSNLDSYIFDANRMSDVPDEWTRVTLNFTTPENLTRVFFVVSNTSAHGSAVLIDDITLEETKETISTVPKVEFVDSENNVITNSNAYAKSSFTTNSDGTVNLNLDFDESTSAYSFLGWFDNENKLVSTEKEFKNVSATSAAAYKAKIKSSNMSSAASFEDYNSGKSLAQTVNDGKFPTNDLFCGMKTTGCAGVTYDGTVYDNLGNSYTQTKNNGYFSNGITATVTEEYAHSGKKSLYMVQPYWSTVTAIENIKAGATYDVSFYIKRDPTVKTATKFKDIAVVTTANFGAGAAFGLTYDHISNNYAKFGLKLSDGKTSLSNVEINSDEWVNIKIQFTVPENMTSLDTVYLLFDSAGKGEDTNYVTKFYLDDISVTKEFDDLKTAYNDTAALREATSSDGNIAKNGMRIYNKISKAFIDEANIVEYGSIAALKENVTDELTLKSANVVKGTAYEKTTIPTPILWKTTDTDYIFTSYLTNIPERNFGSSYCIRTYAIDAAGYVYYGETIDLSVFTVAYAIDRNTAGITQSITDITAFNSFTKGSDNMFTSYDAWLKQNGKLCGKLRKSAKAEDTLSGTELTKALEETGYYEPLFEKAIANEGNMALLKRMFEKAQNGQDITVVGFGGSITQKAACQYETESYSYLVAQFIQSKFPDIKVEWHNAGIGATTSVLGISRINQHVLSFNPDLVIVDFTTNDQLETYHAGSYEAVLRTLLENEIATVTIMYGNVNNAEYQKGIYHKGTNREDLHAPVMLYNDVPIIDYYGTMWDCYLDADGDGYNEETDSAHWNVLWNDYIHPTVKGHKLAANAINYYLEKVLNNLDNITTEPSYPKTPLDQYTKYFMNAEMYGNANVGSLLTDSANTTEGSYNNYDSTTVTNWTIWQIEQGGYIEFTIPKCKLFALMSINSAAAPTADIYINDTFVLKHVASSTTELNWMNYIKFFDGEDTIKVKIACTSGTYRITAALVSQG